MPEIKAGERCILKRIQGNTDNVAEYYHSKHIAKDMRERVKKESRRLRLQGVRARVLILSVEAEPVLSCIKAMSWADITVTIKKLRGNTESMKSEILNAAQDADTDGIIICDMHGKCGNLQALYDLIPAKKDIMCVGAEAVSAFLCGRGDAHIPCRADACVRMLGYAGVDLQGKNVTVTGRGREQTALAFALLNKGASVTVCAELSEGMHDLCMASDVIVTWTGKPKSLTGRYVNDFQTIVDMGQNTARDGSVCGDVDIESTEPYVHGFILGSADDFCELCDYVTVEHILNSAASRIK